MYPKKYTYTSFKILERALFIGMQLHIKVHAHIKKKLFTALAFTEIPFDSRYRI